MHNYEVRVTEYAENALREIGLYILNEFSAPQAAINTLKTIRKEIETLNIMPERIHLTPEEPWMSLGIHRMTVKNFYVYFWIDTDANRVQITNVVYVGRDQKKQLDSMPLE